MIPDSFSLFIEKGNGFPVRETTTTTTTPSGPVRGVRDEHFHDDDDSDEKRNQRRWRRSLDVDDDADDVFARLPIFERKVAKSERKSGE